MVWWWVSNSLGRQIHEGTQTYRLGNSILEILGLSLRPYVGAASPGFVLVNDSAQLHVVRMCSQFLEDVVVDFID